MYKAICLLLVVSMTSITFAQDNESSIKVPGRTTFFAELGGPGILFSANIDSRFKKSSFGWGGRAGLGFVTADELTIDNNGDFVWEMQSVVTIPVQINYIFGKSDSPHTFEVGGGLTYVGKELEIFNFYDNRSSKWFGTASFMYRRQPLKGGFTWRAGFTPLVARGYIQPSGAVSVGYSF